MEKTKSGEKARGHTESRDEITTNGAIVKFNPSPSGRRKRVWGLRERSTTLYNSLLRQGGYTSIGCAGLARADAKKGRGSARRSLVVGAK